MRARTLSLLLLLLLAAAASSFTPSTSTDTIYRNTSLTGNQTLVSAGGIYALGFFSPAGADGRTYLGIWYASIPGPTTVVWVANRKDPVVNSPAALQLSDGGRLVILDGNNETVWSSAVPTVANVTAAQLLDTGNLVLSADGSGSGPSVAWQSFDYPTDTLLPGMKLGVDTRADITRNITAWRSPSDPSPGDVTFKLVIGGLPQFFLLRGATRVYTSGPWNGDILTGVPYLKAHDFTFKLVYSPDETYYSYFIREPSLLSRLVVDGAATQLKRFSLNNGAWNSFWYYPTDQCDYYAKCGPFGYCDTDRSPPCSCLPGFVPRSPDQWSQREWSAGCVRSTNLSCDGGDGDGFWVVNRMKLPQATDATVYAGMTLDQCRQACLGNCSCGAYAAANNSGGIGVGCVIWTVDLLDMRQYPIVVQDVYIRLAQSDIDALKAAAADNHQRSHKSKLIIIIVATISGVLFLLAAVGCCCFWMKKTSRKGEGEDMASSLPPSTADFALPYRVRSQPSLSPPPSRIRSQPSLSPVRDHKQLLDVSEETRYYSDKDVDLPLFELEVTLAATDNFAEHKRIGAGGFGPVYMGVLEDGQQVAVKRLSQGSTQGVREFMNEVKLIAKLQHRNLVRLLGCCIESDERMLVYEYMHNQSLDTFIFDEAKRRLLRWQKRFEIILGIARGLQYLHEDSRFRIIHRDLKASNVLLDRNMVPKISDFGIARMFGGDQTTAYTRKVVGT
ncbi:receptor-like serine/threonine-protein kinase SD1-8 isoform X2 [Miscanthus floridulus]